MPNFNTLAMGFLFTVMVTLGLGFMSEIAFDVEHPDVPGYRIEVAGAGGAEEAPAEEEILPIGVVMAMADAGDGASVFRRCAACHTVDEGGANRVGPPMWDIVNRPMAGADGFGYSSALTEYGAGKVWTYEELYGFLADPKDWVDGTSMSFAGLRNSEDRGDVIAYLRSLSNDPAPLPEVESESEETEEAPASE